LKPQVLSAMCANNVLAIFPLAYARWREPFVDDGDQV
jgi:hypothetical protein